MAEFNTVLLTFEVTTSNSPEDLEVAFNTGGWPELTMKSAPQHYKLRSASLVEDDDDDEPEIDESREAERTASKAGDPPNVAEKDKPQSVKGQPSPSADVARSNESTSSTSDSKASADKK